MLVHRDCIFYKYTGTPEWKEIELGRGEYFSSFKCELYESGVIKAKFQWVDPIKVRDKIVTTERKTIDFLIFEDVNVVCIFGGSESHIAYTISKISLVFPITLKKVDLFEKYKEYVINNEQNGLLKLQSIDVSKEPTVYDSDEYINFSTKGMEFNVLKEYIETEKLVSFVISIESIPLYFFLDYMSVVSFMDTDEIAPIINACKRIVKYIA